MPAFLSGSLLATLLLALPVLAAPSAEQAVVKIITFAQEPQWDAPWRFKPVGQATGSGFVIEGRRILTNAHVVSWAKQILVKRYQDPTPYLAKVSFAGHDCDLALLEVEDSTFFDGLPELEIGELPQVRTTVVTYGYPAGGEQISYTRGVVSRIEMHGYAHPGNRSFLIAQTDAAINPGNSGGPVIQDGKAVGVAFQGIYGLENTGFFIPPPIVRHFLQDVEDGVYHSFPVAGLRIVPLENPAYRRYLQLPDTLRGARVDGFLPLKGAAQVLEKDDVLIRVDGHPVGSDGTILFHGNRLHSGVLFDSVQHGDSLPLTVWRNGGAIDLAVPMEAYHGDKAQGNQYDTLPGYFVYAGMVFVTLSRDYLETLGRNWYKRAPDELIYELQYHSYEDSAAARPEPVVLVSVMPHPINANMAVQPPLLVDRVNGVRIDSLAQMVRIVEQEEESPWVQFQFEPKGALEVFSVPEVKKANPEILREYAIPGDRRL